MERLWNRNYLKVMTANFALFFAFYLLTPLLPLYLYETFGATKDVIGLVLSGYTIVALLFRPFSGFFVDSFPRKMVLLIAYSAFAIFFAGYLAASSLLLFTIVRTLHGGPFGAVTVANSTVAIDVLPSSRRNEGIGYYGLSNNLAMAISPTFALFVYSETHNFQLLFWLAFAVALFGLIVDSTVTLKKPQPSAFRSTLSLCTFRSKNPLARPLLPEEWLAHWRQHGILRFLLWSAEQLSRHLWQTSAGHDRRHGCLVHALFHRTHPLAPARRQSPS